MKGKFNILILLVASIALLGLSACDSDPTPDGPSTDANNLFIGEWDVISGIDSDGSVGQRLDTTYQAITFTFTRPDNFTIFADSDNENVLDGTASGTFQSNNETETVQFSVSGTAATVTTGYDFTGDEDLSITFDASTTQVINTILGTPFQGQLQLDLRLQ